MTLLQLGERQYAIAYMTPFDPVSDLALYLSQTERALANLYYFGFDYLRWEEVSR